jgi:hypothetical protein
MKYLIICLLLSFPIYALAGDLYYSGSFTSSQQSQVENCFKLDSSFSNQVHELTQSGDLMLRGMIAQRHGYLFLTMTNAFGSWMNYRPLNCDTRSEQEKVQAAEVERQNNIELAEKNATREAEAAKTTKLKKERAIDAEKKRVAAIKSKGEEFYGALCHSQLDDWSRNTYKIRATQFRNNCTKVVIFVSDFRDQFPREFECKITSVSCVSNSDPGGPRYETEVCAPS